MQKETDAEKKDLLVNYDFTRFGDSSKEHDSRQQSLEPTKYQL